MTSLKMYGGVLIVVIVVVTCCCCCDVSVCSKLCHILCFKLNNSAQFIVVSVTRRVTYGAVLKTEQESRMNTAPANVSLGHSGPATRNVGAVGGRSACGAR